MRRLLTIACAALAACSSAYDRREAPLKVAAAADLALAFPELGAMFTRQTGREVVFSFGSSGLLAKQIDEGGPFDVYAAANVGYVDGLVARGRCNGRTIYGIGRLAVLTSSGSASLDALADARFVKIAIAHPDHAPYGMAAEQALTARGLWTDLKPRLVYAENARQAFQLVTSRNVEAALVPLSLAASVPEARYTLVDEGLHAPLEQGITACGPRADLGARFVDVVMSVEGRAVMRKAGFVLPGEIAQRP